MGVGMEEILRARHDAHMAFPKHEVAARKRGAFPPVDGVARLNRLHVGVARHGVAGGGGGELHQP